ncbi:MAG TPA: DUF5985 family protein [Spongiibacteraceae bacterium]|jgi:hypothetical protein
MNDMLVGAITLANLLIGLFFLRFWRGTRDSFFLYFALSFSIEGLNRLISGLTHTLYENAPLYYLVRLISYSLIVIAIWKKNKRKATRFDDFSS